MDRVHFAIGCSVTFQAGGSQRVKQLGHFCFEGFLVLGIGSLDRLQLFDDFKKFVGVIDGIVPEPLGGAQGDWDGAAAALKEAVSEAFAELSELSADDLVETRYQKFANMGSVG